MQHIIDRLKAKRDALDEVIRQVEAGHRVRVEPWMLPYGATIGTSTSSTGSMTFGPFDIEVQW